MMFGRVGEQGGGRVGTGQEGTGPHMAGAGHEHGKGRSSAGVLVLLPSPPLSFWVVLPLGGAVFPLPFLGRRCFPPLPLLLLPFLHGGCISLSPSGAALTSALALSFRIPILFSCVRSFFVSPSYWCFHTHSVFILISFFIPFSIHIIIIIYSCIFSFSFFLKKEVEWNGSTRNAFSRKVALSGVPKKKLSDMCARKPILN